MAGDPYVVISLVYREGCTIATHSMDIDVRVGVWYNAFWLAHLPQNVTCTVIPNERTAIGSP